MVWLALSKTTINLSKLVLRSIIVNTRTWSSCFTSDIVESLEVWKVLQNSAWPIKSTWTSFHGSILHWILVGISTHSSCLVVCNVDRSDTFGWIVAHNGNVAPWSWWFKFCQYELALCDTNQQFASEETEGQQFYHKGRQSVTNDVSLIVIVGLFDLL